MTILKSHSDLAYRVFIGEWLTCKFPTEICWKFAFQQLSNYVKTDSAYVKWLKIIKFLEECLVVTRCDVVASVWLWRRTVRRRRRCEDYHFDVIQCWVPVIKVWFKRWRRVYTTWLPVKRNTLIFWWHLVIIVFYLLTVTCLCFYVLHYALASLPLSYEALYF